MAAAARAVGEQARGTRAKATSGDGAVTASVTASGTLERIRFAPAAEQLSPEQLAEDVLQAVSRAGVEASGAASALIDARLRADDPHPSSFSYLSDDEDGDGGWTRGD